MAGLEIWAQVGGRRIVELVGERYVIGKADDADIVLTDDSTVSAAHAMIERIGTRWYVRDLNARNGTVVNKERIVGERSLRDRDELVFGKTRVVYFAQQARHDPTTDVIAPAPRLTERQHEALIALCRPLLSGDPFTPPTPVSEMAKQLFKSKAAIRMNLDTLYDKFDIPRDTSNRMVALANEAVRRGAVTLRDIEDSGDHDDDAEDDEGR
ncbi:MAG TPA: FHA domain-containing protein [Acidimicrobiia bacterium]